MDHNSLEIRALYHKAKDCYTQSDTEKYEEAFQFLQEAAEKGMAEACKLMGLVYMSGQYAPWPDKDEEKAVYWWTEAAKSGDEEAMYWLGQCYQNGIGTEADEEEARRWMEKASAHGFIAEEEIAEELPMQPENVDKAEGAEANETQPTPDMVKEAAKDKEEEEAEAERFAREEEQARRMSNQYRMKMGIGGAICCLLAASIVVGGVYWLVREKIQTYEDLFWVLAGVIAVIVLIAGYAIGVKKAAKRLEQVAEYRKTAFYHAFGCELGQMNSKQEWCYKVYQALAKNYQPVTYRRKLDLPTLREYRGCLYTNWIYQNETEKAQPEFVIVTEKAIYVIHTENYTGRIQGDLHDTQWSLFSDGEKDLTPQKIANMVDENTKNIGIIKADLAKYCRLPLEQIPFYNVVYLNPEVDIKALRRVSAEDNTVFVQGGPDKLRGSMGIWESRLATHNLGMEDLTRAFEQIGKQFLKRSGW